MVTPLGCSAKGTKGHEEETADGKQEEKNSENGHRRGHSLDNRVHTLMYSVVYGEDCKQCSVLANHVFGVFMNKYSVHCISLCN